jgi:outer membrane protein W
VHYCGGELSSISIGAKSENPCTCGSKKMKKNCCEDKTFSYEVDDNQAKTQECLLTFSNSFNLDVALPSSFEICYVCFPTIVSEYYFHHPPNNVKPPLYILNQVFRI